MNRPFSTSMQPSRKSTISVPSRQTAISSGKQSLGKENTGNSRSTAVGLGRQSMIGGVRKSSIFAGSNTFKDPRPQTKENEKIYINMISSYLMSHNFSSAISPKTMKNISQKELNQMVQFLYQQIDPRFVVEKNEDIALIFGVLNYPISLVKRHFTVPITQAMIAAVAWLVELLVYEEQKAQFEGQEGSEFDDEQECTMFENSKHFFEFTLKGYPMFLANPAETPEERKVDEQHKQFWEDRVNQYHNKIRDLEQIKKETLQQIEKLQYCEIPSAEKILNTYKKDVGKLEIVCNELHTKNETLLKRLPEYKEKYEQLLKQRDDLEKERIHFQGIVDKQDLSVKDVEKMLNEKKNLQDQLDHGENQKNEIEKTYQTHEMLFNKKSEMIETQLITRFNNRARELQLIPQTTNYAAGTNYTLGIRKTHPNISLDMMKTAVLPGLEGLKQRLSKEVVSANEEKMSLNEKVDKFEEANQDKRDELVLLEKQVKAAEEAYKREKGRLKQVQLRIQNDIDDMQKEIDLIRDSSAESQINSENKLSRLEKQLKEVIQHNAEEQERALNFICTTLEQLELHKKRITEALKKELLK